MKKISIAFTFLLSANLLSEIEILDRVAILVDDGLIMESQIKKDLAEIIGRYDEQNIKKPSIEVLQEQVVERLIIDELQLQMANRAGIRISDSELNETITRIAANNGMDLEEFISIMANDGASYEDLREGVREEMIIQRIQRGRVGSEINITEKEFAAYLATDESLINLEPELLVRQILVSTLGEAESALIKLNEGKDFAELASEISTSGNASSGGLMPWRKAAEMPKLFSDAINFKEVGYTTPPLESGSGYHVLKLDQKRGDLVQYEDQWSSRHILLMPSAIRSESDTENELNEIRLRVVNGEDFKDLADEFSEDPGSAKLGGELGWLGKGVLAPEFEQTMLESETGELSDVFQTQFGFHFLEVLGTRNHDMTRELIEDRAYQMLYSRKYDEELENTLRSMRAEAFVEFKDLD
jgi:peptidyl-prolyl cis-trans isomerase SurA